MAQMSETVTQTDRPRERLKMPSTIQLVRVSDSQVKGSWFETCLQTAFRQPALLNNYMHLKIVYSCNYIYNVKMLWKVNPNKSSPMAFV